MREIFFRGKRIDNGEWVYGFYSPVNLPLVGNTGHFINECGFRAVEIQPETVSQYTGLTDKIGIKIFEGDIVRYSVIIMHTVVHKQIMKITFKKGSFCMEELNYVSHPLFYNIDNTCLEVIGNIHDNPELLKGEEK